MKHAEERLRSAEHANLIGLLAMTLCLMTSCGMCFSVFIAFPLSLWGLSLARSALAEPDPPDAVRAYARPALYMNLVSALFSGAFIALIVLYVLMYVGLFAFVGLLAASVPPPPPPPPAPMPIPGLF